MRNNWGSYCYLFYSNNIIYKIKRILTLVQMLVHNEFLFLDHKKLPHGRLWSIDNARASRALNPIWKVPRSYGGRSTIVGSRGRGG